MRARAASPRLARWHSPGSYRPQAPRERAGASGVWSGARATRRQCSRFPELSANIGQNPPRAATEPEILVLFTPRAGMSGLVPSPAL